MENRNEVQERQGLIVKIKKRVGHFLLQVDFSCGQEIFTLFGASGCGKSLTLRCIAGLETPDEGYIIRNGTILFDATKGINLPPRERGIGYMFQDYALFPHMTVEKNIKIAMGKQKNEARYRELIEAFCLQGLETQMPSSLSGGQKQRTAMARMMAAEPEVILLDEPFSALDASLKWQLEQEMKGRLKKKGSPVLFVSHDKNEVYHLSDRIGCMHMGYMEPAVDTKQFFKRPSTITQASLSGCENISYISCKEELLGGERNLYFEQWKLRMTRPDDLSDKILAAGIRAYHFTPKYKEQEEMLVLPVTEYELSEDLRDWIFLFRTDPAAEWLQWRIPKESQDMVEIPKQLYVKKTDILWLYP